MDTGEIKLIFNINVNVIYLKARIYDDKLLEGAETFGARLIVPDHHRSSGLKLCNPSHVTVFIKDGMFHLHTSIYTYLISQLYKFFYR